MANLNKNEMLDDFDIDFDDNEMSESDIIDFENDTNEPNNDDFDIDFKDDNTVDELEGDLVTESDIEEIEEETVEESESDTEELEVIEKTETPTPEEPQEIVKQDVVLYIIADRKIHGMLQYFRDYGVNVSKIFTDIEEARNTMLMQTELSRLVVIDTGTGRFTNMASRRDLVDLMGICDEETKISIFYTDSVIRTEINSAAEVDDKHIEWFKYKSTAVVLANLLQKTKYENYCIYEDDEDDEEVITDDFLHLQGLPVKTVKTIDIGEPTLREEEIRVNMSREAIGDSGIQGYKIRL